MEMKHTVTTIAAVGFVLGLMSAPVMARNTAVPFDNEVKDKPPLVLAQETPSEEHHEAQRYKEQVRKDQHQAQQTAMRHNGHHRYHHKHHTLPVHSVPEGNNHNEHEAH
jgi:hypothetical protein